MRKLGRASDQRKAMLRGLVSDLLWNGRIETTEMRAKEVRRSAEKLITKAIKVYDKSVVVEKSAKDEKGNVVTVQCTNDAPEKLAVRRQLIANLYDYKEVRKDGESKSQYKERTADISHPLIEKMFTEIAPKYAKRAEELGQGGGYTRIIKKGPRRGDAAETVIIELV